MEDFNIGLLADRISASNFSSESIYNNKSFGGHNFWLGNPKWENVFFKHNVITKPAI